MLTAKGAAELVEEAKLLVEKVSNVMIGLRISKAARKVAYQLQGLAIKTVMTDITNMTNAMEAILAGATYIAPAFSYESVIGELSEMRQLVDEYGVHVGLMTSTIR
ncbi:hypothetical protein [uncultured Vagococcus sp.]|uniref:hypothetical protein n=1 Tax=uncultured Vagococcus sp. TaxID=189676 RepID=UPI0028D6A22A|nr:hypothetical protein [uncultured Vagococcus sp.]